MRKKAVFVIFRFGFQLLLCSSKLANELRLTEEFSEGRDATTSTSERSLNQSESNPCPSTEAAVPSADIQPSLQSPRETASDEFLAHLYNLFQACHALTAQSDEGHRSQQGFNAVGVPPRKGSSGLYQLLQLEHRERDQSAGSRHNTHIQQHPQLPNNPPALQRTPSFASQQPQSPAQRTSSLQSPRETASDEFLAHLYNLFQTCHALTAQSDEGHRSQQGSNPVGGSSSKGSSRLYQLLQLEHRERRQSAGSHHTQFQHDPHLPNNPLALQRSSSFASQLTQSPAERTSSLQSPRETASDESLEHLHHLFQARRPAIPQSDEPYRSQQLSNPVGVSSRKSSSRLDQLLQLEHRERAIDVKLAQSFQERGHQDVDTVVGSAVSHGEKREACSQLAAPSAKYKRPSDPNSEVVQSPTGLAFQLERLNSERVWRAHNSYMEEGRARGTGTSNRGGEEVQDFFQKVYSRDPSSRKALDPQVNQWNELPSKPAQPVFFPEEASETFASIARRESEKDQNHPKRISIDVEDVLKNFSEEQILDKDLDKWKFLRMIEGAPAGLYQQVSPSDGKKAVLILRHNVPCKNNDVLHNLRLIFKQLWHLNSGILNQLGLDYEGDRFVRAVQRKILRWVQTQLLEPDESLPVVGYVKNQAHSDELRFGQIQSQVANFLMTPETPDVYIVNRIWSPWTNVKEVYLSRQEAEATRVAMHILGSYYKSCEKPKWEHMFGYEIGFLNLFKFRVTQSHIDRLIVRN